MCSHNTTVCTLITVSALIKKGKCVQQKCKEKFCQMKPFFPLLTTPLETTILLSSIQCPLIGFDSPLRGCLALMNAAGRAGRKQKAAQRGTANPLLLSEVEMRSEKRHCCGYFHSVLIFNLRALFYLFLLCFQHLLRHSCRFWMNSYLISLWGGKKEYKYQMKLFLWVEKVYMHINTSGEKKEEE